MLGRGPAEVGQYVVKVVKLGWTKTVRVVTTVARCWYRVAPIDPIPP